MQWRNRDEPITRKDAFDYIAALRVRGGQACMLSVCPFLPWSLLGTVISHADGYLVIILSQVIFGAQHDQAQWNAHAPEAMDGQFINQQRWVSMVSDSRLGFGLFEALPHLCKPLS
jgi:hypothetical protein